MCIYLNVEHVVLCVVYWLVYVNAGMNISTLQESPAHGLFKFLQGGLDLQGPTT